MIHSRATFDSIRAAVNTLSTLGGKGLSLDVKTVCVEVPSQGWHNFSTLARLVPTENAARPTKRIDFPSVTLVQSFHPIQDDFSEAALQQALAHWRNVLSAPSGYPFLYPATSHRQWSQGEWEEKPCWQVDLSEIAPDQHSYGVPYEALFNVEHLFFARTVGEAAATWLGNNRLATNTTTSHSYSLIVPDLRGAIGECVPDGNELTVAVQTAARAPELHCAALRTGTRGERETLLTGVANERAYFHFSGPVQELELLLFTSAGECLDRFTENPRSASWKRSIYNKPRAVYDTPFADLTAALMHGESEHVEYKSPTRLKHTADGKVKELLKTCCAFANSSGGSIYVGVQDDATFCDMPGDLRRMYGNRKTRAELQDSYTNDLKKLLAEGVRPSTNPTMDWIDVADLVVLRVDIPRGVNGPYSLVETRDGYVRRGATNRKLSADELLSVIQGRDPQP